MSDDKEKQADPEEPEATEAAAEAPRGDADVPDDAQSRGDDDARDDEDAPADEDSPVDAETHADEGAPADARDDEDAPVDEDEEEVHVLPVKLYFQVFGMLIVLTVLTVLVSVLNLGKLGLGSLAIGTALAVAVAKSGLVVGYFMHLKYDMRFYSLVFFSAVLFVGLFIGLTMVDLTTRQSHFSKEEGTFVKKREAQEKKKSDRWLKEAKNKRPAPRTPPPAMAPSARTPPRPTTP